MVILRKRCGGGGGAMIMGSYTGCEWGMVWILGLGVG
ncbi:predicted protein [Sclerotinia sclerotiorum 1980 UF-70]|uniref:Uncharacterized protein n=1 Tax=Sclerotinia sclerotiorum (strain ATCC 18683 / 1980 / Ss-1) TaxID=665079 RepID=A7F870_SCLS1|nr:predicted protein [Sclerotinia sclerotiorum 1980 UF-70]EDN98941.1 predicted protein [Sclerotinia sclerotiorum 1980 UF-70]